MRRFFSTVFALVLTWGLVVVTPGAALAHDVLEKTGPADGATVAQLPQEVILTFSDTPIEVGTQIIVKGPSGNMADGAPVIDGAVAADDSTRQLVLAEATDPRWWASIDGVQLQPSPDRSPVTFTVPEDVGGDLEWGLRHTWWALGWQIAVGLLILALLAPTLGGTTTARRVRE